MEEEYYNRVAGDRIQSRQIDELIGIAKGLIADDTIRQVEVEFLEKWLASNQAISNHPLINRLYRRVAEVLADGLVDAEESADLFGTMQQLARGDFELGEALKATTLPLNIPPPNLTFAGKRYCFTGTFNFGQRKHCEQAVVERGAEIGSLTQKTDFLVIGIYATDSWKHSTFGNKILKAVEYRDNGLPIAIVSEDYWSSQL